MKINIYSKIIKKLIAGEMIPASRFPENLRKLLSDEGLLHHKTNGSRSSFYIKNIDGLINYLNNKFDGMGNIETLNILSANNELTRAEIANLNGNSKSKRINSCPGFAVNSYSPINAVLNGNNIVIYPPEGSFIFISDWKYFAIPNNVIIIGIENMENFRNIRRHNRLFENFISKTLHLKSCNLLFVSRYPISKGHDLTKWLQLIPNSYIHFGDFDIEGIRIFETEFKISLGERASFLIPDDISDRIKNGSKERYLSQYIKTKNYTSNEPDLQNLINIIHQYKRCYDQEGYIIIPD